MTEEDKKQEERDERAVAKLLNSSEGEFFMKWLSERSGVEDPVFQFNQGKANTIDAAVTDGRRQTWIELNKIAKNHKEHD